MDEKRSANYSDNLELDITLDELEAKLQADIEDDLGELAELEEDFKKIGTPESLGEAVKNVVWEQFINQIGVIAGEDFIRENRNLTLDLRDSAHIQTTENFAKGKIATHNSNIDYQKRYDDWQGNFQHNKDGKVITHQTRSGRTEANLVGGSVREPFDAGRPAGSKERGTDMDHTISAGEIIRDPAANAHLGKDEQIAFANSETNLNEMNASHNRSKKDSSMSEWLDNPNSKGQTPKEIYADPMSSDYLSDDLENKYREKDKEARKEYAERIEEGEQRSIETGKASQKAEAFRMGNKALRAAIMGLLAELLKNIIQKLISWFRSGQRKLGTLIDHIKAALSQFFKNLKQNLKIAGDTFLTSVATAIWGPIVETIKKAWIFLKQGWSSLKEAYQYIKSPENRKKPLSLLMLEVGKIVIVGLTAGGAIVLSETIEGLMTVPGLDFNIPMLGSIASILGIFLGAVVAGIIGAIALNMIDKAIANKKRRLNISDQIDKTNIIIDKQKVYGKIVEAKSEKTKEEVASNIEERHAQAKEEMDNVANSMENSLEQIDNLREENGATLDSIFKDLDSL